MKEIVLTKGYVAQVDDDLYDWLNQWKWHAYIGHNTIYGRRAVAKNGKCIFVFMHRQILDASDGVFVDHINHDGLCNLRQNLRLCTHAQNMQNRRPSKKSSRYLGVAMWGGVKGRPVRWTAQAAGVGRLGQFKNEEEAAACYDVYALNTYGEFANLNFPERRDEYFERAKEIVREDRRPPSSIYIGVSRSYSKWRAAICKDYKEYRIGVFSNEIDAAVARDIKAVELCGAEAVLNFPQKIEEYIGMGDAHIKELKSIKPQSSSFVGVHWHGQNKRWVARVGKGGKKYPCGCYINEIDAAIAHDKKAIELYGASARLNFPEKINEYLCLINGTKEVCSV